MPCPQESATFGAREALAVGRPLEDVGGLMASLDPYHLGLVLAVLRHAGCGSGADGLLYGLGVNHDDGR